MNTVSTTSFHSILFPFPASAAEDDDALHDLALDQVFARIGDAAPRAASALRAPLTTVEDVAYRQAVFQGLETPALRSAVDPFLRAMSDVERRDRQAAKADVPYVGELLHLGAACTYVAAVEALHAGLAGAVPVLDPPSAGWAGLAAHVAALVASDGFRALARDATSLQADIDALRYNALVRGGKVTIAPVDGERDLGEAVLETFARFRTRAAAAHRAEPQEPAMDHVQAWMLERVARVHPDAFARLTSFARGSRAYRDPTLDRFVDEVRFYLAYLDYLAPLSRAGLPVSYPAVSATDKLLDVRDTWDLALAPSLVERSVPVVTNDLTLSGAERILVVSGPNQGGKTTTARTFGQLHHLAAIGCPVPGRDARIFLCDRVLTVFGREETLGTLEGRLGAEVHRLHDVLGRATDRSVVVINEAFASTALHDARILTRDVLERLSARDTLAACVTFIDELSRLNEKTVSMVSAVDPADPAVRTFRVTRRVADGRAYARALAVKHGLTSEQIAAHVAAEGREAS
ncbi:MAG: hypothetical protein QM713_12370 [Arachnia sp.]